MQLAISWTYRTGLAKDVGFFIGIPLLLCCCMTLVGPYAAKIGYAAAFAYVAMLSFVPWWIAGLTTQVVARWSRRRLPLWLIASLGALVAGPLVLAYASGVHLAIEPWWPSLRTAGPTGMNFERLQAIALSEGRSIVLWTVFVLIFTGSFGWRRFAPDDGSLHVTPRFQVNGAEWTDEDDFQLRTLVGEGLPPRVIAFRMQRTFHAVRARTTKLGLKNNKP